MKVVIIAAGSSSRLADQTKGKPKGLLIVNGKSVIERQILLFKKFGITDITIITGPQREKFNYQNICYIHDEDYSDHDVLGSIMAARSIMTDDIIFSYSDILFDDSIFEKILNFQGDMGIGVDLGWEKSYNNRNQHPKEQADNVIIQNNKILKIKKNIPSCKKTQKLGEFIGLTKLSKKGCDIFIKKYQEAKKREMKISRCPIF